jgi:RNA 2',3'-cyclic 3'-phosphodiesterase
MANAPAARLFIAVDPPVDVCEELAAWAKTAMRGLGVRGRAPASVRLLDPELLHVTLCFLGSRPVQEVTAIGEALQECWPISDRLAVGELAIGAPLWLPPRRPRALAVEVRDDLGGGLTALHDALIDALARACDFRAQRRRYRAHVTLARMRDGRGSAARPLPPTPALSFTPETIVLYRSWLSPAGASYEALATRTLAPLQIRTDVPSEAFRSLSVPSRPEEQDHARERRGEGRKGARRRPEGGAYADRA